MSIRPEPGPAAASAIACLPWVVALAASAAGQPVAQQAPKDQSKLPWLGCWDVMADLESDSQEPALPDAFSIAHSPSSR